MYHSQPVYRLRPKIIDRVKRILWEQFVSRPTVPLVQLTRVRFPAIATVVTVVYFYFSSLSLSLSPLPPLVPSLLLPYILSSETSIIPVNTVIYCFFSIQFVSNPQLKALRPAEMLHACVALLNYICAIYCIMAL